MPAFRWSIKVAIAAFSPRLNEAGNSIRSMKAIQHISEQLGTSIFGAN
jgi:glutaminase